MRRRAMRAYARGDGRPVSTAGSQPRRDLLGHRLYREPELLRVDRGRSRRAVMIDTDAQAVRAGEAEPRVRAPGFDGRHRKALGEQLVPIARLLRVEDL